MNGQVNHPPLIAIIEDDRILLELYELVIDNAGYKSVAATNGFDGLELIEKYCPDLILLDLHMPTLDGVGMLMQLREKAWGKNIPVILLSNDFESIDSKSFNNLDVAEKALKLTYSQKN